MLVKREWGCWLAVFVLCVPNLGEDKQRKTFSLPDSVLLFGTYNDVRVSTPDAEERLRPPVEKANLGQFNAPSISLDGGLIAWGIVVAKPDDRHPVHRPRFSLGIYSRADEKWKTYGDFDDIGATAFSRDGSKVAFVAAERAKQQLRIFDARTEIITVWDKTSLRWSAGGKGSLGWSPAGDRLAIEIQSPGKSLIGVLDLNTGNLEPVGEGYEPAWSPTGEWIAYYADQKCMLVHPDGTGKKVAKEVGGRAFGHRSFAWGLVFSPDGMQLLLNQIKGDGPDLDVVLLDLESGRSISKSKSSLPVFGWVAQRK